MQTTKAQRLETLRQRQKAVNERVKLLEQWQRDEKRKEDTRRKIIIGAVCQQEMEAHPDKIGTWMDGLLAERVTKTKDRALFGLPPLEGSAPVAKLGVGTLAGGEDGPTVVPFELHSAEADEGLQPVRPGGSGKTDKEKPEPT